MKPRKPRKLRQRFASPTCKSLRLRKATMEVHNNLERKARPAEHHSLCSLRRLFEIAFRIDQTCHH